MVDLLHLVQTGMAVTAVTIAAVTLPVALVTDTELPDLTPLIEVLEDEPES